MRILLYSAIIIPVHLLVKASFARAAIAPNLKAFLTSEEGLALKADHNEYLSRYTYHHVQYIWAAKRSKDPYTRFFPIQLSDGSLAMRCDDGGFWQVVQRHIPTDDRYYIYALECIQVSGGVGSLGPWNKFLSFSLGDGRAVAFKIQILNKFLKRTHYSHISPSFQQITADSDSIDEYSTFVPESGALIPSKYEILEVDFDTSSLDSAAVSPFATDRVQISNNGSLQVDRLVTLSFKNERSGTTFWENSFAASASMTYRSGLLSNIAAKWEFSLTLSYEAKFGGSNTTTDTVEIVHNIEIHAAPFTYTEAVLMIKKKDDAVIPFQAKIRKTGVDENTGNQFSNIVYEKGTWSGVIYSYSFIQVNERPLDNPKPEEPQIEEKPPQESHIENSAAIFFTNVWIIMCTVLLRPTLQ